MKNFFKQLLCRHDWNLDNINQFETKLGSDNYTKCIGETIICRKCGKKVFNWIKAPSDARIIW